MDTNTTTIPTIHKSPNLKHEDIKDIPYPQNHTERKKSNSFQTQAIRLNLLIWYVTIPKNFKCKIL